MNYVCDCGQTYQSTLGVMGCQAAQHGAAPGNELADANREAALAGDPASDYSGLLAALDRSSGALTDECFPDVRPSTLDIVRRVPPSRELVELLAKLSAEAATRGEIDLAVELLGLGLCARSALQAKRPLV